MSRLRGVLLLLGALSFAACQQSQEADDDDGEGTTVIEEKETVVQPADEPEGVEMDVEMKGGEGEASGEVDVKTE